MKCCGTQLCGLHYLCCPHNGSLLLFGESYPCVEKKIVVQSFSVCGMEDGATFFLKWENGLDYAEDPVGSGY